MSNKLIFIVIVIVKLIFIVINYMYLMFNMIHTEVLKFINDIIFINNVNNVILPDAAQIGYSIAL